jgi:RNA polymerase sigma factor (sigma-70 family)
MPELNVTEEYAGLIKQQALSVARKFLPLIKKRVDVDDLISEGNLAALEAIKKYDENRQPDRAKYIGVNVRFHLLRYAAQNMYDLNVPFSAQYSAWRKDETSRLHNAHAHHIDSCVTFNGAPDEGDVPQLYLPASGAPVGDELERAEDADIVMTEFSKLHSNEQKVLWARHMSDKKVSREELADSINVNIVTTAAIEHRAISKLHQRLKDKYGCDSD